VTASWRRFTRASDALAAALDIQRAFHAESWPDGLSLKLRIALHTADAQLRDEGNYFGPGGQPLRSATRGCPRRPGRVVPDDP
jgi:class 3 adenylate cyclase